MGFLRVLFLLQLTFSSCFVAANTYQKGYQSYVQGDYAGAESALKKALTPSTSDSEAAKINKLLGISQYMQGKRIEAAESFKEAKNKNPSITINHNEVLDDSVLAFFAGIEVVKTSLLLKVTPTNASAFLDGKEIPTNASPLALTPGIHELEIKAEGYKSIKQPVQIKPSIVNVIKVNLALDKSRKKAPALPKQADTETKNKEVQQAAGKAKSKKNTIGFQSFIPFGAPQFFLSQTAWGVAYGVMQVGALGLGFSKYLKSNSLVTESNSQITEKENYRDTLKTRKEQEAYTAEINQYKDDQDAKISALSKESTIGFAMFGLLWGASVVHGLLYSPDSDDQTALIKGEDPYLGSYRLSFEPVKEHSKETLSFGLGFRTEF